MKQITTILIEPQPPEETEYRDITTDSRYFPERLSIGDYDDVIGYTETWAASVPEGACGYQQLAGKWYIGLLRLHPNYFPALT